MTEPLCHLCNHERTGNSDPTDEGFWAVTVEDPVNPGVARAYPVHTSCMKEKYPELVELVRRELVEMGSTG